MDDLRESIPEDVDLTEILREVQESSRRMEEEISRRVEEVKAEEEEFLRVLGIPEPRRSESEKIWLSEYVERLDVLNTPNKPEDDVKQ